MDFANLDSPILDEKFRSLVCANEKDHFTLALLILKECAAVVRCNDEIYQFNGKYYELMREDDLSSLFHKFVSKYAITKAWAGRRNFFDAFRVNPSVPTIEAFNDYPSLVCVNNGILDLYTRTLIPHSKDMYFDSSIKIDFDPDASSECPHFLKYLDDVFNGDIEVIDNIIRLGGYLLDPSCKANKMFLFDGPGGCLDKDTFIPYSIYDENGKLINSKGGSIELLYERFHNKPKPHGKGGYHLRIKKDDLIYKVSSINKHNSIFKNQIVDVVKSGVKECFKLTTSLGKEIIATADHKFFNGVNYVHLGSLLVGDTVFVHNNTHYKNLNKPKNSKRYTEICVKYHPSNHIKRINGYSYYRVKKCRMIVEAEMNGMSFEDYRSALNTWSKKYIDTLFFLPEGVDIHHLNKNSKDDRRENLQVLSGRVHDKHHTTENYDKMRFIAVPDTIISIESVGERETYDIKCLYPYNNFIADGIVVHNSGKSTLIDVYSMFFHKSADNSNQVTAMSLEELASGSFDKEDLIRARLNICAETKKGFVEVEEIKKIVTGDLIKVSRKLRRSVTFVPKVKIVAACNGLPTFKDTSDGTFRRLVIFRFTNQFRTPEEIEAYKYDRSLGFKDVDEKLWDHLASEKNAIFRLFLDGLIRLRENKYKFIITQKDVSYMKKFRQESDSVREFLETYYRYDPEADMPVMDIYADFRQWYKNNVTESNVARLRSSELGKRLKEVFNITSLGRKAIWSEELKAYERQSIYPLARIVVSKDDGLDRLMDDELYE